MIWGKKFYSFNNKFGSSHLLFCYILKIPENFIKNFNNRIINIHPSSTYGRDAGNMYTGRLLTRKKVESLFVVMRVK